MDDSVKLLNR